jgi:PKD repeat protein
MASRTSTSDANYVAGNLSVFPTELDTKETLYEVSNNAVVPLKQTLTHSGKVIIVEDTSLFPDNGIVRIGSAPGEPGPYEMIYYSYKTGNTFRDLIRGFAGSKHGFWTASNSYVSNSVDAEHHNAIKDAIINIQTDLGIKENAADASLNGILTAQEVRFLAPKPLFRAFPLNGPPALKVRFQNLSSGHVIRYLWDFGDGGTSVEKNPIHTYVTEGYYTVRLNVITSAGAQGVVTKSDYIKVSADEILPFFYVESIDNAYSEETATSENLTPKEFIFVDQTDGDIVQRHWVFGDGETYTQEDPDIHTVSHIYQSPGEYTVTELIQFSNNRIKKFELSETLVVL